MGAHSMTVFLSFFQIFIKNSSEFHTRGGRAFHDRLSMMMMILLLFLQKQNLAFAIYLLGSVLSLPD